MSICKFYNDTVECECSQVELVEFSHSQWELLTRTFGRERAGTDWPIGVPTEIARDGRSPGSDKVSLSLHIGNTMAKCIGYSCNIDMI